jgi:alkylation response protein AidB-like acyl-CoA dehydrogenase
LRALLAAEAIGAAEQCLAKVAEYAQIRMAYGRPITAFQAIRHLLADMRINLDFAKSALFWALEAEGEDNRRAARLSADLCVKVGAGAFQVYGGIAYTWELGLHRYLRHIEAVRDVVS